MAKKLSKLSKSAQDATKKSATKAAKLAKRQARRAKFAKKHPKIAKKMQLTNERRLLRKNERVNPHHSFRRSYREDYRRDLEIPGIMYHIIATFKVIFKNWRLFLPLLILAVLLDAAMVGLMSEETYVEFQDALDDTDAQLAGGELGNVARAGLLLLSSITTGGLAGESSEAGTVFLVLIFVMLFLVTIYLLRQRLAGNKVKLRDGLYNAMTPLVSAIVVVILAVIQCLPILILVIAYSAAVQTEFLATPFYALLFFIFGAVMILLSGYLLSSTLIALIAVSAPGLYPLKAIQAASDLMMGRRIRFILRLVALFIAMIIVWVVVMLPIILFDLLIKQWEWTAGFPLVPICLNVMTCFTMIYVTAYLYLYYRWMLDYEEK